MLNSTSLAHGSFKCAVEHVDSVGKMIREDGFGNGSKQDFMMEPLNLSSYFEANQKLESFQWGVLGASGSDVAKPDGDGCIGGVVRREARSVLQMKADEGSGPPMASFSSGVKPSEEASAIATFHLYMDQDDEIQNKIRFSASAGVADSSEFEVAVQKDISHIQMLCSDTD
ncbi:hypothetical protein L1987_30388 [Smallanthus sonchifolius]|uniref:Uncharacterized protein n=1 Tax=Smallanthus sonchifolius TaxID=185202 RepID=A0ACB9I3F8_9ASTR|nr:hypothetical protein L1987_30388 [Smallanthus sonchifolius]